jgi:hypothetical protein
MLDVGWALGATVVAAIARNVKGATSHTTARIPMNSDASSAGRPRFCIEPSSLLNSEGDRHLQRAATSSDWPASIDTFTRSADEQDL